MAVEVSQTTVNTYTYNGESYGRRIEVVEKILSTVLGPQLGRLNTLTVPQLAQALDDSTVREGFAEITTLIDSEA